MSGGAFSSRLMQVRPPVVAAVPTEEGDAVDGCGGGAVSSTAQACCVDGADAELGSRFQLVVRAASKRQIVEDLPGRERDALRLLRALQEAYSDGAFQAEIRQLQESAGDELGFLTALSRAASCVQEPVFRRFGFPAGQRGVMLMKMAVKVISGQNPAILQLSGDLRELLGLRREEELQTGMASIMKEADIAYRDLLSKISKAPVDVRGPLAEALRLPYKASPQEIAQEVPKIRQIARELADKNLGRPRSELAGDGKLLGPEAASASEERLHSMLVESFEHYLNKMLARVITPVESFTRPPAEFCCEWAERVVQRHHVLELWGPQPPVLQDAIRDEAAGWLSLGVGVSVIDGVLEANLASRACSELAAMEASGDVQASKDPCNVGARAVWLHFETPAERSRLPPVLGDLCDRLAGLPHALLARATEADGSEALDSPSLRVHPHVMAATYRKGAEYHVHKDSYNGTDNQRMLTILLYINDEWRPGDAGELRIHGTAVPVDGGKTASGGAAPDEGRFVDVAPLSGRLVMFRSREVWHAVKEPREQRWALTLWVMAA